MIITIIAGSNREDSSSTKLCKYLQKILGTRGYQVNFFDVYKQPVPFFSTDQRGVHDRNLKMLKACLKQADGIVLSTPEYHGGISGILKNALDHLGSEHFEGKTVLGVNSCGGSVGVSSLLQLQAIVRNLHGINCSEWISIGGDNRHFNKDGEPESLQIKERVEHILNVFLFMAEKLSTNNQLGGIVDDKIPKNLRST